MTARKPKQHTTESTPASASATPADFGDYWTDAAQRTVLFLDTLLNRGNSYIENLEKGTPSLLKFNSEMVLDGRDLPEPCNYALLHLLPPDSMPVNPKLRPVVVVDPR
ncbi:MAG TPA: DUF3141 domain-containing protein, partial [Rhodoferax sp.]|nr:DUF3141 domain-containing protein [Rhodoferax sp.]